MQQPDFDAERRTAVQGSQNLVHDGQRDGFFLRRLTGFTVGVELLGEGADAVGKREREVSVGCGGRIPDQTLQ